MCLLARRRGRPRAALAFLLLGGLGLRLYAAGDGFLHGWDEAYHALVAKNLIHHPLRPTLYETPLLPYDYRDWTANHAWLHKPPLALWTMALSMALLGVGEWHYELDYNARHLSEPLEGHGRPGLYHLLVMPRIFGELVFVPLALFAWRLARPPRDPRALALGVWIAGTYAVFSLAATKMPAYVMVAAPAVCLLEAEFVCWLSGRPGGSRWRRVARAAVAGLLLLLPLRLLEDALRVFRPWERRPAWAEDLRRLGDRLAGSRAVILNSPRPIETMFYTSQTAYGFVPERGVVERWQAGGYRVLIENPDALGPGLRGWPGVEYRPAARP